MYNTGHKGILFIFNIRGKKVKSTFKDDTLTIPNSVEVSDKTLRGTYLLDVRGSTFYTIIFENLSHAATHFAFDNSNQ